jgi:hypothetical protein
MEGRGTKGEGRMANGEWRMENGTALPFSILLSSIIEYAQSATPIIGEAFPIPHSPFFFSLFSFLLGQRTPLYLLPQLGV